MRTRLILCAAAAVATAAPSALAQQSGFQVNRFEPAERGSDWFTTDSLDLRSARDVGGKTTSFFPAVGVTGDYNYRSLVVYNPDDSIRASVVRNQVLVHLGASVALFDRLRLGVDLPFQAFADGHQGQLTGQRLLPPANEQAVGDLRLAADLRLFGKYGDAITGAIGAQVSLPTGDASSYLSDGQTRVAPRAQVAGDLGPVAYAARLAFQYRGLEQSYGGSPIGSEFDYAVSLGVRALEHKLLVGPELFGSTVVSDGGAVFATQATPVEGVLGAHYRLGAFVLGGGVGAGLTRGFGAPTSRALLSFEWSPEAAGPAPAAGPSDTDGDGVTDDLDACRTTPGVRTSDPKTNGCPAPLDSDHDGVIDSADACPTVAGVASDDPKKNGCPPDRDGDGIPDAQDACPDVAGVASEDPKKNGCPPDKDGDGIPDAQDACPDVAGVASTDPRFNGCPPDKDGDGVKNEVDACPDEKGEPSTDPKKNGCPKAFVANGQIKILDQVRFKTASAEILPGKDSQEVLNAVLGVLQSHAEIKKVRVEGHTDNRGAANLNKKLSDSRAASVVKWLVAHGVDAKRLSSQGFGQEKPITTNDTDEGRQLNRRVEFQIDEAAQ